MTEKNHKDINVGIIKIMVKPKILGNKLIILKPNKAINIIKNQCIWTIIFKTKKFLIFFINKIVFTIKNLQFNLFIMYILNKKPLKVQKIMFKKTIFCDKIFKILIIG